MKRIKLAIEMFMQRGEADSASESLDRAHQEIRGSIFTLIGLFELVSLTSYVPVDSYYLLEQRFAEVHNLGGIVGAYFAEWLLSSVGIMGYAILAFTAYLAYASFRGQSVKKNFMSILGGILATLLASMACYIGFQSQVPPHSLLLGGKIGTIWGGWLLHYFNTTGAALFLGGGFLVTGLLTTDFSLIGALQPLWSEDDAEEDDFEEPTVKTRKKKIQNEEAEEETEPPKAKKKPKKKKKAKKSDPDKTASLDLDEEDEEEDTVILDLDGEPTEEEDDEEESSIKEGEFQEVIPFTGKVSLPSLRSLVNHSSGAKKPTRSEIRQHSKTLCQHLLSFNITGEVETVAVGPVLTTYEFRPSAGVKLKSIAAVEDDLGIVMGTPDLRIVAPIPGKTVVGIEVPRAKSEIISLKQIVGDDDFYDKKIKLPVALGKSTDGKPIIGDLAAMPHLLVAGATGSGKSVFINSLIMSFLYRLSPQQIRLVLIDPKMLELNVFDGLPHLVSNVVTKTQHAINALNWAVLEMENRYQLMAQEGSKNIDSYNSKKRGNGKLPYIVIVVDELADLMLSSDGEVEQAITRLAQKARAAGIHLVIATQRPSTDVITGLIKANIPSRLAFKVPSAIDSRTVLDASGAQALIGRGDSLMIRPGKPMTRIHGCFVDEDELRKAVKGAGAGKKNDQYYIDFSVSPNPNSKPAKGKKKKK